MLTLVGISATRFTDIFDRKSPLLFLYTVDNFCLKLTLHISIIEKCWKSDPIINWMTQCVQCIHVCKYMINLPFLVPLILNKVISDTLWILLKHYPYGWLLPLQKYDFGDFHNTVYNVKYSWSFDVYNGQISSLKTTRRLRCGLYESE